MIHLRRLSTLLTLAVVGLLAQPAALAQSTGDAETTEVVSGDEPGESEANEGGIDEARARRLRIRGIILTVIGLSMTGGGATMAAFGFDDQRENDVAALRPLSIVFMGVGLALSGVGVADMVIGLSARSRAGDETEDGEEDDAEADEGDGEASEAFRFHPPRAAPSALDLAAPSLTVHRSFSYLLEYRGQARERAPHHLAGRPRVLRIPRWAALR